MWCTAGGGDDVLRGDASERGGRIGEVLRGLQRGVAIVAGRQPSRGRAAVARVGGHGCREGATNRIRTGSTLPEPDGRDVTHRERSSVDDRQLFSTGKFIAKRKKPEFRYIWARKGKVHRGASAAAEPSSFRSFFV